MPDLPGAAEWLLVVVGLTTIWLAIGLFVSRRLAHRPALAHRVLGLCMLAAVLTPLLRVAAALCGFGLFVDPGPTSRFHAEVPGGRAPPEDVINLDGPVSLLACIWAVFSLLLLLRLLIALRQSRRLARSAELESEPDLLADLKKAAGVDSALRLGRHPEVTTPMLWSWGQPVLLLPPILMPVGLDPKVVFQHELAHLRRGDAKWALLAEVIFACLFWHPLAWLTRRRLALYAEFACDDAVLASGVSAPSYATTLLDLAVGECTIGALAITSQLSRRVRRLLRPGLNPYPTCARFWTALLVVVMLVASTGLALARSRHELREPLKDKSLPAVSAPPPRMAQVFSTKLSTSPPRTPAFAPKAQRFLLSGLFPPLSLVKDMVGKTPSPSFMGLSPIPSIHALVPPNVRKVLWLKDSQPASPKDKGSP